MSEEICNNEGTSEVRGEEDQDERIRTFLTFFSFLLRKAIHRWGLHGLGTTHRSEEE